MCFEGAEAARYEQYLRHDASNQVISYLCKELRGGKNACMYLSLRSQR
jgi:hypothetical protein